MRFVGYFLIFVGLTMGAAAIARCQAFAHHVETLLGAGSFPEACLYQLGGECKNIEDAARVIGAQPYEPMLFWAAVVVFGLGAVADVIAPYGRPKRYSSTA